MFFMIAPQVATSILINVWAESVRREGKGRAGTSMKNYSGNRNGTNFGNAWQSPVPYLLGGVVAMFLVITLAIVVLVCSCRSSSSSTRAHGAEALRQDGKDEVDKEQGEKVAVIMAGDENPTFIATPTPVAV